MTTLAEIVEQTKALLLDFDGPVSRVFAGLTTPTVVSELHSHLADEGIDPPVGLDSDPLQLLVWVDSHHRSLAGSVDDRLSHLETAAVESATPTAHAHDVIMTAKYRGLLTAVVSNNSQQAIERYLALHSLTAEVTVVVGRAPGEPMLLKPHPHSVQCAIDRLGVPASSCALVGDSAADIIAARAAGVHSIGYAKIPERRPALVDAGADAIVDSMGELAAQLVEST